VYTAEADPHCYPGTTVLRNLLDIQDPELLEEAELALFLTRAEEPFPAGEFDVQHYLSLHRHLFQDVYPWAGDIRTIRIGKAGNWFCYPEYIAAELNRVFVELGTPETLARMTDTAFAAHVGHFLAEVNAMIESFSGNEALLVSVIQDIIA
jgi:cell filamentation protein